MRGKGRIRGEKATIRGDTKVRSGGILFFSHFNTHKDSQVERDMALLTQWGIDKEPGHSLPILVTPWGVSTFNLATGAWRDREIPNIHQRPTNEITQERALGNSHMASATSPSVEGVTSQIREGAGSISNTGIDSAIEQSLGSIIPMYLRSLSQDTIVSATLPTGRADPTFPNRCWSWRTYWYRMEVLLSQVTMYGELCCAAELLDAVSAYAQADNQLFFSTHSCSSGVKGASQRPFKRFQNWWATRQPFCHAKNTFPQAPLPPHCGECSPVPGPSDWHGSYESIKTKAGNRVMDVHSRLQTEWTSLVVWLGALAA
ncbi:hypothetical protein PM082_000564 [Marasmius tenuissimus]|nr:hypothetical protein PM082_000564 [Marasmius tenuissimus]